MPTPEYGVSHEAITSASAAVALADKVFAERKAEFEALSAEHARLHGASAPGTLKALLRKYGPIAATYFGLPGGAAAVTALTADPGAFTALRSLAGKIASLFGFGG